MLFAVLLVVAGAAVVVAGMLSAADARLVTSKAESERSRSRALAWSGVRAVMAQLEEQRDLLLAGAEPVIEVPAQVFVDESGRAGVVRLEELSPGRPWASEAGKLNVNVADAAMLAKLPGMSAELAQRIVEARGANGFASVEDLARVEGMTPDLLYGEDDEVGTPAAALVDLVTVSSFDPRVQAGLAGAPAGVLRVRPQGEWTERLQASILDRVGQSSAGAVRQLYLRGGSLRKTSEVVNTLRTTGTSPAEWGKVLDLFTAIDDEYAPGLVDINAAPAAVLSCVPGLEEAAQQIASQREGLDEATRSDPAWIVVRGLVTPEQFEAAADWITTRSVQYRVRVVAGFQREREGRGDEFGVFIEAPRELEYPVVFEAVVDAASRRVRVASLRDVTGLADARAYGAASRPERVEPARGPELPSSEEAPRAEREPEPGREPISLNLDSRLERNRLDLGSPTAERSTTGRGGRRGVAAAERAATPTPAEARPSVDRRSGRWRAPGGGGGGGGGSGGNGMEPRE